MSKVSMNRRTFFKSPAAVIGSLLLASGTAEAEPVLRVYRNECEWYVAESLDDAWSLFTEQTGLKRAEYMGDYDDPLELLSDESHITIVCNEKGEIDDHGTGVRRTCAEWAKREGRGLLASTEY